MRIIYLSPHLDDTVLSAGGIIGRQAAARETVEIWTVMAGVPEGAELSEFAQVMHTIWGFSSAAHAVTTRRGEDRAAAAQLGAKPVHFGFLDAIYRRGRLGQALYSDVTVTPHAEDASLPERISAAIAALLAPDDRLVCQLAVGKHVDHVLVRAAAELLHRPLEYIADIPYLLNHPGDLSPSVVGMCQRLEPVSEHDFQRWVDGVECYVSQIDSVFGSHEAMLEGMRSYWIQNRGIRFWSAAVA